MSPPNTELISHPLLDAKIARLNDRSLGLPVVRQTTKEISSMLAVEASRKVTPGQKVAVIPILRSGLSMTDALVDLISSETQLSVYHLGLFREKVSLAAVEYYNKIPTSTTPVTHAIIVDPLIATGNTAAAAIDTMK
jgi:uracil phosphoribosyltransferase